MVFQHGRGHAPYQFSINLNKRYMVRALYRRTAIDKICVYTKCQVAYYLLLLFFLTIFKLFEASFVKIFNIKGARHFIN
jgi:hypothetical protein